MSDLNRPLHHCYLLPASSVSGCLESLKRDLKALFFDADKTLTLDVDAVDLLDIETARGLRSLGLQQSAGEARCIIRAFDTATVDAQNALLKIIESPAEGVHFFFVTPNADQLLETVRSRVWQLPDFCAGMGNSEIADLVTTFLQAKTLPGAFTAVENLEERRDLRAFVRALAAHDALGDEKRRALARTIEDVAGWSRDTGSSVKLLRQQLAIASQQSTGGA